MISGKENLKREIGVRALTLALLNILIGSGIFVIPAIIAETLGTAAIVAYWVCGVLVFLIALCFAEVASKTTTRVEPGRNRAKKLACRGDTQMQPGSSGEITGIDKGIVKLDGQYVLSRLK